MRNKLWLGVAIGVLAGVIVAPKIRTWFPSLPSYGGR